MAIVKINESRFDIDGIIFDKDGTLINFNRLWGAFIEAWIDFLIAQANENGPIPDKLVTKLDQTLGYNRQTQEVIPDSPLAVTTLQKIELVAMTVLYQHQYSWHVAEEIIAKTRAFNYDLKLEDIEPIGDVASKIQELYANGIQVIIATNDDRAITEKIIDALKITPYLAAILCGDDPRPSKPDPAGITTIEEKLAISPGRMLMVGDTVSDMRFGRNGRLAGCIAILSGGGKEEELSQIADELILSLDEIELLL